MERIGSLERYESPAGDQSAQYCGFRFYIRPIAAQSPDRCGIAGRNHRAPVSRRSWSGLDPRPVSLLVLADARVYAGGPVGRVRLGTSKNV